MNNRIDQLVLAFILLAMAIVIGADRFLSQTDLSQLITGILTGLLIVASIFYVIRISSQSGQKR